MKVLTARCRHDNATVYAVQKLGTLPPVVLYNCPDCKTTISEEQLLAQREAEQTAAKLAVA